MLSVVVVVTVLKGRGLNTVNTKLQMSHEILLVDEYLATPWTAILELPVGHLSHVPV